ncbi:putative glycosyltransferase EpsJ [Thalassoglobus neptunius]|uniref:Putative glycosyltransferase EpsJ n=1 Tax=Thalassoglobus neptunius TaxID=1938619 RepID=A0A5C5X3W6_9PLAN|nr:glycosyltransferase family 2 protein [Thalassoglobus neptunius]TWT57498.1 putative glycosyltransferase EpsJ [Thalassoglobus neptunius]
MIETLMLACTWVASGVSIFLGVAYVITVRQSSLSRQHQPVELEATQREQARKEQISVIVPARDEELDLANGLDSILAQQNVDLEVIVINDHSSDRTGEIADEYASRDSRVTVIHDPPLPKGWLGKANAMEHGRLIAQHAWIVLTDADVVHSPECFATAIQTAQDDQLDMLSLGPRFDFHSFWENVLLPHALIAGVVHFLFQNVNSDSSPHAAGAGAFILLQKKALEEIGAMDCIKTEMLDDVSIANRVRQSGLRVRLWLAPELLRVRLFKGNHHAFWGLTKNILGVVPRDWMALFAMWLPIFMYWIPIATAVVGIVQGNLLMTVSGIATYVIQALLLIPATQLCTLRFAKALCFPLAAFPIICTFSSALIHRWKRNAVHWRGRTIELSKS